MNWVLLDTERSATLMNFTIREMFLALKLKYNVHVIKLWKSDSAMISQEDLQAAMQKMVPGIVLWIGPDGWRYADYLASLDCQKINVWYDDPISRLMGRPWAQEAIVKYATHPHFQLYVWDSYWADQLNQLHGCNALVTHLAASPEVFFTAKRRLSDNIVFIGSLHSPTQLWDNLNRLPQIFIDMARVCLRLMGDHATIPSWDVLMKQAEFTLNLGDQKIFAQSCETYPQYFGELIFLIWMFSKNEARVRAIRECLKVAPVFMLTETHQRLHALPVEIAGMVGEFDNHRLMIADSGVVSNKPEAFGHLYHHGRIHLNATDPQSVTEGVPYRLFQTMMSGKALLTDWRPGWSKLFDRGSEVLVYDDYREIPDKLENVINNQAHLNDLGFYAAEKAKQFTWTERVEEMTFQHRLLSGEKIRGMMKARK